MTSKNILIIGAGAVGTVYGYYFQNTGHKVSFLVKPSHIDRLEGGYWLNELQNKKDPVHVNDFRLETLDTIDSQKAWDMVIITLSTTALPKLDLSGVRLTQADVVLLSPGLEDLNILLEKLTNHTPKSIITGMINLIAFINGDAGSGANITLKRPMAQSNALTTCVYFPPTAMPFSDAKAIEAGDDGGQTDASRRVAQLFDEAGIKSKAVTNTLKVAIYPNIFLTVFVLALEASNWSFTQLSNSPKLLEDMTQSIKNLSKWSQRHYRLSRPLHTLPMQPWLVKIGLKAAPSLFEFDIEAYLKHHFTKVGEQSVEHAQGYIDMAQRQGKTAHATQRLLAAAKHTRAT